MSEHASRPRGRPRQPALRAKLLAGARELLDDGGMSAVTMEALAARAGVSRPTIYRYWPNAQAVAMDAFLATVEPVSPPAGAASRIEALRAHLRATAAAFNTRVGRGAAAMIAASQSDSELAKVFRTQFVLQRREEGRRLLDAAVEAGELRRGVDADAALDLLYAPLYLRLLIGHGPLDERFADAVFELALHGLRA
jgi:AcrR family transcriptional regulator